MKVSVSKCLFISILLKKKYRATPLHHLEHHWAAAKGCGGVVIITTHAVVTSAMITVSAPVKRETKDMKRLIIR